MRYPVKFRSLEGIELESRPLHLAIGMFDGVHLGHKSVIEAAVHSARRENGIAGVLTFWPHPSVLFRPENPTRLIMDPANKTRLFRGLGAEIVIEQPFDSEFASISAEEFVPHLVRCLPALDSIYVGENWGFGKGRKGDVDLLLREARKRGVSVISMPRLYRNGEPISSSRIRECLIRGAIEEANSLLGYSYFLEGEVREGRGMGREIGFPTLNIPWAGDLEPLHGVYGVRVDESIEGALGAPGERPSARVRSGVANFGLRPTVAEEGENAPILEVHLLDESCPFDRGDRLFVELVFFIRPEEKFSNLDALKIRIRNDRSDARERFGRIGG